MYLKARNNPYLMPPKAAKVQAAAVVAAEKQIPDPLEQPKVTNNSKIEIYEEIFLNSLKVFVHLIC